MPLLPLLIRLLDSATRNQSTSRRERMYSSPGPPILRCPVENKKSGIRRVLKEMAGLGSPTKVGHTLSNCSRWKLNAGVVQGRTDRITPPTGSLLDSPSSITSLASSVNDQHDQKFSTTIKRILRNGKNGWRQGQSADW